MSEHGGNGHAAHDELPAPSVKLTFPPDAGGDVVLTVDRASPAQLYLAAWYLNAVASQAFQGAQVQAAMGGAIGDPAAFIEQLRRAGRV